MIVHIEGELADFIRGVAASQGKDPEMLVLAWIQDEAAAWSQCEHCGRWELRSSWDCDCVESVLEEVSAC